MTAKENNSEAARANHPETGACVMNGCLASCQQLAGGLHGGRIGCWAEQLAHKAADFAARAAMTTEVKDQCILYGLYSFKR